MTDLGSAISTVINLCLAVREAEEVLAIADRDAMAITVALRDEAAGPVVLDAPL